MLNGLKFYIKNMNLMQLLVNVWLSIHTSVLLDFTVWYIMIQIVWARDTNHN